MKQDYMHVQVPIKIVRLIDQRRGGKTKGDGDHLDGRGESGIKFPSESYKIFPEKSNGRHFSPLMMVFLQTASSSSSPSSSSCPSSCTFLQEIILAKRRALLLRLLWSLATRFLLSPNRTVFSPRRHRDFLASEPHNSATTESMDKTAIGMMRKVIDGGKKAGLWKGNIVLTMAAAEPTDKG